MGYSLSKMSRLADEAREERQAGEKAAFARLLNAFDQAIEADDSFTADPIRRRDFHEAHVLTGAVIMNMEATVRRRLAVSIVAMAGIFNDLCATTGEDRREAGAALRILAASLRRSWGLA